MSYHGILADVEALEDAVEALPTRCLYHGGSLDSPTTASGLAYDGACCSSGQPALYRRRAEAALKRLRENL